MWSDRPSIFHHCMAQSGTPKNFTKTKKQILIFVLITKGEQAWVIISVSVKDWNVFFSSSKNFFPQKADCFIFTLASTMTMTMMKKGIRVWARSRLKSNGSRIWGCFTLLEILKWTFATVMIFFAEGFPAFFFFISECLKALKTKKFRCFTLLEILKWTFATVEIFCRSFTSFFSFLFKNLKN